MDLLKKELERKKQALQQAKQKGNETVVVANKKRYLKASELRKIQEEEEEEALLKQRQQQQQHASDTKRQSQDKQQDTAVSSSSDVASSKKHKKRKRDKVNESSSTTQQQESNKNDGTTSSSSLPETDSSLENLSPQQVTQRLRLLGLPIRLFGEVTSMTNSANDSQRLQRLRVALQEQRQTLATLSEKEEFRLGQGHGIRNPFLEKEQEAKDTLLEEMKSPKKVKATNNTDRENNSSHGEMKQEEEEEEDLSSDPHKRIYKYLKGLIKEWENDLVQRPEEVKRSVAGRNNTKTWKQCKDYIRPLFKLCKNRKLEEGLCMNLVKIVDYCQAGEFVKAHDTYMDVAIGRAAWPIGVTMVGIHARTGRSKIESQNVAHVMNSELQRKYLTSVKRLITYAQTKRTDVDPSKKVMN